MYATTAKTFDLPDGIKVIIDDETVSVDGPYHAFIGIKDYVKACSFKWDPLTKIWSRNYSRSHDRLKFVDSLRDRLVLLAGDRVEIPAPQLSYRVGEVEFEILQKMLQTTEVPKWKKTDAGWWLVIQSDNPNHDLPVMQKWAADLVMQDRSQVGPTPTQAKTLNSISKIKWVEMLIEDPLGQVYAEKPTRFESIPRSEICEIIDLYHRSCRT